MHAFLRNASREFAQASNVIHRTPVTDSQDEDLEFLILDSANDAVITNAITPQTRQSACQWFAKCTRISLATDALI